MSGVPGERKGAGTGREPARRVRGYRVLLAMGLGVWIGGCATSPDPHDGGFVSGVAGLVGGGYQRRIDEREGTYRAELDAGEQLKAQARDLERERAAVKGDLARARSRLASQERRIAAERARLAAARQRSAADQARLHQLDRAQARVASAKGELKAAGGDQSVATLKTRSQDIQRDLDEIDGMVGTVAGQAF